MAFFAQSFSSTQMILNPGASTFYCIQPINNQIGIALEQVGISGNVEIAGGGISMASVGYSLVNGVTVTYNFLNGGNVPLIKANGSGFPIMQQAGIWPTRGYLDGAPYLWLSVGNTCTVNIAFFENESFS